MENKKNSLIAMFTGAAVGGSLTPTLLSAGDNTAVLVGGAVATQAALIAGVIHSSKTLGSPHKLVAGIVGGFILSTAASFKIGLHENLIDSLPPENSVQVSETQPLGESHQFE